MNVVNAQIVSFTNTNYFIYNTNGVRVFPTSVDAMTSSITAITPDDIIVERGNMDELMEHFTSLGFEYRDPMVLRNIWHRGETTIQVRLTHDRTTSMILKYPSLVDYMVVNGIAIVHESDFVYIYLNELYDEHKSIFDEHNATIHYSISDGNTD
jgi:hypothetical protein